MRVKTERDATKSGNDSKGFSVPCDRRRILVVEDEANVRALFGQMISLHLSECHIDVAVNGAEAVEEFRVSHHGVIVMDLFMPVMDGQAAFVEISKLCQAENIEMPSVVFCTGHEPPVSLHGLISDNPAHCVLRKPMSKELLMSTLKERLSAERN